MTTTGLTYRVYEDTDFKAIMQLWEECSGWGAITEQQFRRWYLDTPHGACVVIVAIDETDRIMGQLVFTPSIINLGTRDVKALRASAPILHESLKNGKITDYDHPAFSMFRKGMEVARERGFGLIYFLPALGWTAIFKLFPKFGLPDVEIVSYDCFKLSLQNIPIISTSPTGYSVKLLSGEFDEAYDQLWSDALIEYPLQCCVQRSAAWLKWKLGANLVFEVREQANRKLKGYVALKKDSGLIVDCLARNAAELKEVILFTTWAVHHLNPDRIEVPFSKITGMYSAVFQDIFPASEIEFEKFSFAFGCYPLKNTITHKQIEPANWYIMPND